MRKPRSNRLSTPLVSGLHNPAPQPGPTDLVDIPAGTFTMGSRMHRGYPEEAPQRQVSVEPFQLERHPVTNIQFARFIRETGYLTVAERTPDPAALPEVEPGLLVPGALVFSPTDGPVSLDDWQQWWRFTPGACWHRPHGPGSSVTELENHPVVQVTHEDAVAYALWRGRRLPTEAEFEYASRSGRPETFYSWGDELRPNGLLMANTWQGDFPYRNTGARGWRGTSPVGFFPADPWGTVDLIGNVWEWTDTYYAVGPARDDADRFVTTTGVETEAMAGLNNSSCCGSGSRSEAVKALSKLPGDPMPRRVVKGGSHLCAPEYCHRYRPGARQPQAEDSASSHLGFRCAA